MSVLIMIFLMNDGSAGRFSNEALVFGRVSVGYGSLARSSPYLNQLEQTFNFQRENLDALFLHASLYKQINPFFAVGGALDTYGRETEMHYRFREPFDGSTLNQQLDHRQTFLGASLLITPWGAFERDNNKRVKAKRFVPYAEVGSGVVRWELTQSGDSFDADDQSVTQIDLTDRKTTHYGLVGVGLRIQLGRYTDFDLNFMHTFASDTLEQDFSPSSSINLDVQVFRMGIHWRY